MSTKSDLKFYDEMLECVKSGKYIDLVKSACLAYATVTCKEEAKTEEHHAINNILTAWLENGKDWQKQKAYQYLCVKSLKEPIPELKDKSKYYSTEISKLKKVEIENSKIDTLVKIRRKDFYLTPEERKDTEEKATNFVLKYNATNIYKDENNELASKPVDFTDFNKIYDLMEKEKQKKQITSKAKNGIKSMDESGVMKHSIPSTMS